MIARSSAAIETLAAFVEGEDLDRQPAARLDRITRHIVDTIGAWLAGTRTPEGLAIRQASNQPGVLARIAAATATTRCTEADDIHLASCTTPGAVVVPTALALASTGLLPTWGAFRSAVLAGYEVLIRAGLAIRGPAMLLTGVWPTRFAAPLGSAAVACRAYGLDAERTAGALATALALCSGAAAPARSATSSRWLSLGAAAAGGVLAARWARDGIVGSLDLIDRNRGRLAGVAVSTHALTAALGRRYAFDAIGMKPYPTARQALAAVEAARELAAAEGIDAPAVERIVVGLPEPQRAIVDHPGLPAGRMASIVSVQYQIALALAGPDRLTDIVRTPPFVDRRVRALVAKVRVRRARRLERHYPGAWPGEVAIRVGRRRLERRVVHPRGDCANPFGWDETKAKFRALAAPPLDARQAETLLMQTEHLAADAATPPLWDLDTP